jgi:hypothetical protein
MFLLLWNVETGSELAMMLYAQVSFSSRLWSAYKKKFLPPSLPLFLPKAPVLDQKKVSGAHVF